MMVLAWKPELLASYFTPRAGLDYRVLFHPDPNVWGKFNRT